MYYYKLNTVSLFQFKKELKRHNTSSPILIFDLKVTNERKRPEKLVSDPSKGGFYFVNFLSSRGDSECEYKTSFIEW